jgi:hypothetical protein
MKSTKATTWTQYFDSQPGVPGAWPPHPNVAAAMGSLERLIPFIGDPRNDPHWIPRLASVGQLTSGRIPNGTRSGKPAGLGAGPDGAVAGSRSRGRGAHVAERSGWGAGCGVAQAITEDRRSCRIEICPPTGLVHPWGSASNAHRDPADSRSPRPLVEAFD